MSFVAIEKNSSFKKVVLFLIFLVFFYFFIFTLKAVETPVGSYMCYWFQSICSMHVSLCNNVSYAYICFIFVAFFTRFFFYFFHFFFIGKFERVVCLLIFFFHEKFEKFSSWQGNFFMIEIFFYEVSLWVIDFF